jgi:hypothetical protein
MRTMAGGKMEFGSTMSGYELLPCDAQCIESLSRLDLIVAVSRNVTCHTDYLNSADRLPQTSAPG